MTRFRPVKVVIQIVGVADDGNVLIEHSTEPIVVPWHELDAFVHGSLPQALATLEENLNQEKEELAAALAEARSTGSINSGDN